MILTELLCIQGYPDYRELCLMKNNYCKCTISGRQDKGMGILDCHSVLQSQVNGPFLIETAPIEYRVRISGSKRPIT